MKPKCISDYAFLEENTESLLLSGSLMQASATLQAVQISAFYSKNPVLHSQVCFGKTTAPFQTVHVPLHYTECRSCGFYLCRATNTRWTGESQKFTSLHEGRSSTIPCPDIHSTIRFKPLDLLRPTSNRTPLTCSKYRFESRSFLKCLLPPQQPRMVQPPPKFLPIYYHKRLPWNTLGGPPFVRGAKCFC